MSSPRRLAAVAALVVLACFAVACGDDDGSAAADPEPTPTTGATPDPTAEGSPDPTAAASTDPGSDAAAFPVTVSTAAGEVTVESRPERIVSLSPASTEILFAIGAGERVVAVDSASDFPAEAPTTDLSGFDTNPEALAAYEPDLVVISFDPGELVAGLEALGVPAIVHPPARSLAEAYAQIEQLGAATGTAEEAAEVVAAMRADIAALVADVPDRPEALTYFYELDPTYYSVTSSTFAGEILGLAGLTSIADAADDGSGFPQLSEEFILDADPDVIVLADTVCCGASAQSVAQRPGWDQLTAVREGRVIEVDDSLASRWGPRIVEFLALVVGATADMGGGAG